MPSRFDDVAASGSKLLLYPTPDWVTKLDIEAHCILFVHGFTSSGKYLSRLASYFQGLGYCCLVYEYDSYGGIDEAGEVLGERLKHLSEPLSYFGYSIVAHSMGGLVGRYLQRHLPRGVPAATCMALLGTPNKGTLARAKKAYLSLLLDCGEYLSGVNPYSRQPACRSARQLLGEDSDRLIATLNTADAREGLVSPTLTISGGLSFLEVGAGKNAVVARVKSTILQWLLSDLPNDGLVPESSSDLRKATSAELENAFHRGEDAYVSWKSTNHTYLTFQQAVAEIIENWLAERGQKKVDLSSSLDPDDRAPRP